MQVSTLNKFSLAARLSFVAVIVLGGATFFAVNTLQQQQNTRSNASLAANTIANPGFESGTGSWQFNKRSGSASYQVTSNTKVSGNSSAQITVTGASTAPQEIELAQYGQSVTAGQKYTFSFWAKSSNNRTIDVVLQDANSPFAVFVRKTVPLTTNWQQFTQTFTAPQSRSNMLIGLQFANSTGTVWIDDVVFSSEVQALPTATNVPASPTSTQTTLSVDKTSVARGGQITATWSNIPNPSAQDKIGLYAPGQPDGSPIGFVYVSCSQTATVARAAGSCTYTIPTTVPLAQAELRLHAAGTNVVLAKSSVFTIYSNTPTPNLTLVPTAITTVAPTTIPTRTVTPASGHTTMQTTLKLHGLGKGGDSANPNSMGNFNLQRPQRIVTMEIFDVNNQLVATKQGPVSFNTTNGNFVGTIDLGTQFSTGQYTVKVKTDQHLRGLVPGIQTIASGQNIQLQSLTLVSGDVNNDNQINIIDYNFLMGCYSDLSPAVSCAAGNKQKADLTDDGDVNQFDYNLFVRELSNRSGDESDGTPQPTPTRAPTVVPTSVPSPVPTATTGRSLLKPATTYTTYGNLRYSNASPRLLLDLYVPDSGGPAPLIIYVHGGSWSTGSKDKSCLIKQQAPNMIYKGFAVACINYRLLDEASFPAQIEDVKGAIRFLRANAATYKIYGNKIGIWGSSAGGHLSALAGTIGGVTQYDTGLNLGVSSSVQAVVDDFGPTDFLAFAQTPGIQPTQVALGTRLLGCDILSPECEDEARAASSVTYVTPDDPPFSILHGTKDNTVPLSQSQLLYDALRAKNVPVNFTIVQGMGHGGLPTYAPARIEELSTFFDLLLR
ncbi:MAG: carbohydrate binding domain-containing protein [Candidatus Levybacteria bacterium]|nr:carbohydrate binding domain-containing protein [Candidatus Levybacteria bacterium]